MINAIGVHVFPIQWSYFREWVPIYDDPVFYQEFSSPEEARKSALSHRGKGRAVIIRPTFNEPHLADSDRGYREWHSFNGELFSEIHFWGKITRALVRLDEEIILPHPPK